MSCKYCTGNRKALDINRFYFGEDSFKQEVMKIYRKRSNRQKYFIGIHTKDFKEDTGTMLRNNGFKMTKQINFCPMCGDKLGG